MSESDDDFEREADQSCALLVGRIIERLEAGEDVDLDEVVGEYPQHEDRVRRLLPTIRAMLGVRDTFRGPGPGNRFQDEPASKLDHTAPTFLGEYQILGVIGRGGMGVVYRARQAPLEREVALKVLPFAALADVRQLKRFQNEARAAASLHHSHIVPIFSVGQENGVHYYAMQYIEGPTLSMVIDQLRTTQLHDEPPPRDGHNQEVRSEEQQVETALSSAGGRTRETVQDMQAAIATQYSSSSRAEYFRTVATWGIQLAEALSHAHENGVIHRDIKPSNLLVDVKGDAWIADFGLARLESSPGVTMSGDIVGTMRYMSPEQASGESGYVDHRTDIYSLGVTLYELLALHPPLDGTTRRQLLRQIESKEPPPLRRFEPKTPRDLETIVLKSMAKDAVDRYPNAQRLADDLRRFLDNRPVLARPPSLAHRARKWLWRHSTIVTACALTLLVALSVGAVLQTVAYRRERAQRQLAQEHLALAREAVDEMLTKVAATWVADGTETSLLQHKFLERALKIYQELGRRPLDGDPRGHDAAIAYERIADIHGHLGDDREATDWLKRTVELCEDLTARQPGSTARDEQLVRCYRKLGERCAAGFRQEAALEAIDRGIAKAERLAENGASPQLKSEWGRLLVDRGELLLRDGRLTDAEESLDEANDVFVKKMLEIDDLVNFGRMVNQYVILYRRQGKLDDAVEDGREASAYWVEHRPNYYDAKPLIEVEADLHDNLADAYLAKGDLEQAVRWYRIALDLRRQRLGGHTPTYLSYTSLLGGRQELERVYEYAAVADYCETQLRLAAVLPRIGRPYEARCVLGAAMQEAQIINDTWRKVLRFWVLHANATTAVAEFLAEKQDAEAEGYLRLAAALWTEARAQSPRVEVIQSGLHDAARDWDWFRTTYPDYASRDDTRESLDFNIRESAFSAHQGGWGWFHNEGWKGAINAFSRSAKLRKSGQAYDWLHMAMAYHHLGQPDEAKREYDRAVGQMQEAEVVDSELEELRRTAAQLLQGI